jgi:hypothetical protein
MGIHLYLYKKTQASCCILSWETLMGGKPRLIVVFYPRKPSWGRKPSKTSSIRDFQYNAKTKTKTSKIDQDQACTSLLLR